MCKGEIPVTTKVDETTRDFVDEMAEEGGLTRAAVLRQLIDLFRPSSNQALECPSCTQTVRIQPIGGELVRANSDRDSVTDESKIAELTPDTSSKPENTGGTTAAVSHQNEVDELTSKVEKQQQELELLRERMTVQEENIEEIPHVALARIENLEQKVEWATGEINRLIPRVEALTEVSDLDERGICPNCGDELTVERTFTDFVGSSDIQCRGCGRVLSTQT